MTARSIMIIVCLVGVARFAILVWKGVRDHKVTSAAPWSPFYDRKTQPRSYWAFMAVHTFAIAVFAGCAAGLAIGLLPISD
jgi:hypothetical protein